MRTLLLFTLTLSGCVVPKIVGDNPELDTGKQTEPDLDTDPASESDTEEEGTLGATSQPDATSSGGGSTGGSSSGGDVLCGGETPELCEANPTCVAVFGDAEEFDGCEPGPKYLGCLPEMPCDTVLLTVCDAEGDAFRLTNGCIPPGFAVCQGSGVLCGEGGEACAGLDEEACAAKECTAIYGAPHVLVNDSECADYDALEFLGCLPPSIDCPPSIPIVCPVGQTDPTWDVPSGCLVPGFEPCDEFVPACG